MTHDQSDATQEIRLATEGLKTQNPHLAARWMKKPCQNFQRRRFPRPVRSQKANDFSLRDGEGNAINGFDETIATAQQALDGVPKPRLSFMPRMDGFEALQRLKSDPETSQIPVIMLTARAQDRDVLQGYQYGADLYLTKPFSPLELISLVKRVFESQEEEEGTYRL